MKVVVTWVVLLLVLTQSEFVEFGEDAVNAIFKEKRDAFILFTSPEDTEAVTAFKASSETDSNNVYSTIDKEINQDHFQRFADYLGITVDNTPTLIYLVSARKKYMADTADLSQEALSAFIDRVDSGEVKPFLKSAPIPTENDSPVKTIVGKNFKEMVMDSSKEVLLKVYAPWCGHCKKIAPEFEAAAKALSQNQNIMLAEFDGTLNEAEEIQITGYPTLFWYPKDKSGEVVTFNGGRDRDGILDWIKDNTQYEWIEPAQTETEEEL